ncbi:hypothetical protein [Streptomyces sp. NPDC087859]|uniref:hypothetical protein n=1 Tax=Streptomyces sp. NPDC087859 TaxID=3365812 RepID=UPI0037F1E4D8
MKCGTSLRRSPLEPCTAAGKSSSSSATSTARVAGVFAGSLSAPGRTGVTIGLSEAADAGTDTFYDVSEFPPQDPNDETWGKKIANGLTPEEALIRACREPGVNPDRWVNQGIVCDEPRFRIAITDERPATS